MGWCDAKYWLPWLVGDLSLNVNTLISLGMPAESSLAICSLILGGVLERLPNLKVQITWVLLNKFQVMFAHGGGAFPGTIQRVEWGELTNWQG